MHLELSLSRDVETKLRLGAIAAGQDLEQFVAEILSEQVIRDRSEDPATVLSIAERFALLDAYVARHPRRMSPADSRRETIYIGR